MRIAMLSWESLHSIAVGGVAAHVTELAAALERKGHDVHVFTRLAQGMQSYDRIHGVHYHRCAMHLQSDFVEEVNGMCASFAHHFACVEDAVGTFDVAHAHDWLAANAMIWIKQQRGRDGVLTMHSTDYGRSGNVFHGGQSERVRHQERSGTYWADKVIAVSHTTKNELMWMYEVPDSKVAVVYNGVSSHRFEGEIDQGAVKQRYGIGPMDPTVLFCGRLVQQKGPDLFVDAKFVFAGDGHMRHGLEQRVGQLGVGHAVRFLGHREGQELVELFKMTDALCVPSRNEPFGIVVLEAWSAGKPVVATMNGGPNEYVRHEVDGLKIHANPDSIAWGLGTLLSDWEKARVMGQAGKEAVAESFTWEVIAGQTLDVYASLPSQSRPAAAPVLVETPEIVAPEIIAPEIVTPAAVTGIPAEEKPAHPNTWAPTANPGTVTVKPARTRRRRRGAFSAFAGRR